MFEPQVERRITSRHFICTATHCRQKIVAERFGEDILPVPVRRTARLESLVQHLGLSWMGGSQPTLPGG